MLNFLAITISSLRCETAEALLCFKLLYSKVPLDAKTTILFNYYDNSELAIFDIFFCFSQKDFFTFSYLFETFVYCPCISEFLLGLFSSG